MFVDVFEVQQINRNKCLGQLMGTGALLADSAGTRRRAGHGRLLLGGNEFARWSMTASVIAW
jgi:hypothetical protein